MFTKEIKAELTKKLNPKDVKQRVGSGGQQLDYLEGWYVIQEANRIFGPDGWSRETVFLEPCGEPVQHKAGKYKVAYRATVKVTANGVVRYGSGFGNGIGSDPVDVHELALKEAETDAMKRALATFGNPFGLALYDKTRANVGVDAPPPPSPEEVRAKAQKWVDGQMEEFSDITDLGQLAGYQYKLLQMPAFKKLKQQLPDLAEELEVAVQEKLSYFNQ
jgi:DNA repair and recombination protein RAD52